MFSAGIVHFIYNETIVSRALPSSSVDYNWFTRINVWQSLWNYSLVINTIYNSGRRHTLLLSPSIYINSATLDKNNKHLYLYYVHSFYLTNDKECQRKKGKNEK